LAARVIPDEPDALAGVGEVVSRPRLRSSSTVTSATRATSRSIRQDPMKPAPPFTRTRITRAVLFRLGRLFGLG
jgi:hypothetical protein